MLALVLSVTYMTTLHIVLQANQGNVDTLLQMTNSSSRIEVVAVLCTNFHQ